MQINRLDHLVLTVVNVEATCAWYSRVLVMEVVSFAGGRTALVWGNKRSICTNKGKSSSRKLRIPCPVPLIYVLSRPRH